MRVQVARVGLSRMMLHPLFGHGMDAMHVHWQEWGFPGSDMLHLHSTPLQLAFDRGLAGARLFGFGSCGFSGALPRAAKKRCAIRATPNRYGILLGATGAVAGFFASSLVNYNFGDGEVALVFWWLMGIVVVLTTEQERDRIRSSHNRTSSVTAMPPDVRKGFAFPADTPIRFKRLRLEHYRLRHSLRTDIRVRRKGTVLPHIRWLSRND